MTPLKLFLCWLVMGVVLISAQTDKVLEQKIRSFILDLENEDFYVKKHAKDSLLKIGEPALPFLEETKKHPNPDVTWQATELITKIKANILKKPDKQNKKKFTFRKKFEFQGPGFQFKFRFDEVDKMFKELSRLPEFKKLQQFKENHSLTIVENHKRYDFQWLKKNSLLINTTDFTTGEVKNFKVKNINELRQKYPEIYQVYVKNGGNSLLKPLLDNNKFFNNDIYQYVPKQFQKEIEEEIKRSLSELYKMEEKLKDEVQNWEKSQDSLKNLHKEIFSREDFDYGVKLQTAAPVIRAQLQLDDDEGVVVVQVANEGLLVKAGLKEWDLLVKVNGKKIGDRETLNYIIGNMLPGEKGTIELIRKGKKLSVKFIR